MVPAQRFDKPGKSPFMDMQLVPKYADAGDADGDGGGTIRIAADVRQNLGMRTVVVKRGSLETSVRVPGTIAWNLRLERVVSARVDTIVDRLYVRAPLDPVRAGQPLATVLAPEWSTAIAESHALGSARSSDARALQSAAQRRLKVLGLPAGSGGGSGGGRDGRITLTSPLSGVVSEISVREGEAVRMGTPLFRVNGTETVWLEAALPQADSTGVRAGSSVTARVGAFPGRVFDGRVETLLPQIDMASRTQRARVVLDNPDGLLAPGMFAEVTLAGAAVAAHPLVPTDAVIGGGTQSRVIVRDGNGRFRPVAVELGRSAGGSTEVLSGLDGGERVVASGQFLLDSEASLSGALERLRADDLSAATSPAGAAPDAPMQGEPMGDQSAHDAGMQHDAMQNDGMPRDSMQRGGMRADDGARQ